MISDSSSDFSFDGPFRKSRRGVDIHVSLVVDDQGDESDPSEFSLQSQGSTFDLDKIPFQQDFHKKSAQVTRQKSLDEAAKRVQLKNTFVRWIRSVTADLPFVSLNSLQINYLSRLILTTKFLESTSKKVGCLSLLTPVTATPTHSIRPWILTLSSNP